MAILTTITDSTGSFQLPYTSPPISMEKVDSFTDVVTLGNDMYTDFVNQKRGWKYQLATLTKAQYSSLKGFYDRQYTLYQYPMLTISEYPVTLVTVRMYLNTQEVYNNCGDVEDVEISFRETSPLDDGGS